MTAAMTAALNDAGLADEEGRWAPSGWVSNHTPDPIHTSWPMTQP